MSNRSFRHGSWRSATLVLTLLLTMLASGLLPVAPVAGQTPAPGTPVAGEPVVIVASERVSLATPSGEQVFRLSGTIDDPLSLDPALGRDLQTAFITRQIFRGLTRLNADLIAEPELAERIEISPDGRTYTFTLREGLTFQQGNPLTARDVAFSLTRAISPVTTGGNAALLAGPTYLSDIVGAAAVTAGETDTLRGLRVIDDRTLEITLAEPNSAFLTKLASPAVAVVDANDVTRDEWWTSPNGSGPFMIEEWSPGERLVLAPFEGYFAGKPPLEAVTILFGPSAARPFNLYQAGLIDSTTVPILAAERVLDPNSAFAEQVSVTPVLATGFIAFRSDVEPMDDPHIRRAVQLAFPRHKIADVTFDGLVLRADGLVPPGMAGREWPVPAATDYDLAAARAAVAASRYGRAEDVPPIRIFSGGGIGSTALQDVLEADLGLTVEVIQIDWPEFNRGLGQRGYPAYELLWGADYPDPQTFLWSLFASDSPDNYVDYANPEYDAALAAAARTLDADERATLYDRAQAILASDNVMIPLYHSTQYNLARPSVRGLTVTPLGILYLDSVWMEQ